MKCFGLAFLCVLLFSSCKTPIIVSDPDIESFGTLPRIIDGEVKKELYSINNSDTSELMIGYSFFSTQFSSNVMDSVYKDSVNSLIAELVAGETLFESGIYPLQDHFFTAQLDSMASEWENYKDEESNPWEMEMSVVIQDYSTFAEVTASGWSYTGGAHGNGYNNYFQIDKSTGKALTLADFFTDVDALNKIAESHFRKLFELTAEGSLNDYGFWFENDQFSVYENFTMNREDVLFFYNLYDIAPYSGGPTELFVPMEEIKHLLKRDI
ncbi:MAG: DUF3298 domain-containing protein [Crocinitomicaceae bacterium]|nr:DUF3298 domain-containing protein [Crocinitomicaceae bacterium]